MKRNLRLTQYQQSDKEKAFHIFQEDDQASFFKFLRKSKVLISGGRLHNLPYAKYIEKGYFNIFTQEFNGKNYRIGVITTLGQEWLEETLLKRYI